MRTVPGEILDTSDDFTPRLSSTSVMPVKGAFMVRAMRRHFSKPLKQQQPRGVVVSRPGPGAPSAVLKVWQPGPSTTGRHLNYLTREGTDGPGQRAALFTEEGRALDRKVFATDASHDPGQYRMILSVQDHARVDYVRLTRILMTHVQTQALQAPVEWMAAVHRNTAHPHVHLVIRGVDRQGREVHFTHDYRLRSMRYYVQHVLQQELGVVVRPQDVQELEGWAEAHVKETTAMQESARLEPTLTDQVPKPPISPPRTLTTEEAQRRLDETRERLQALIGRMDAKAQGRTPAEAIRERMAALRDMPPVARQQTVEQFRYRPDEPERTKSPRLQATPSQDLGL